MKSTRRFCFVASTPSAIARCAFCRANRAGEDQILRRGHPLAPRERMDLGRGDAVGGGEVEGIEGLHLRKARLAQPLTDDRLVARGLLGGEHFVEIVLVGPMRIARLTGQRFKRACNARQFQGPRLRDDEIAARRCPRSCHSAQEPAVVVGGIAARHLDVAEGGRHRIGSTARCRRTGVRASSSGVPVTSATVNAGTTRAAPYVSS